MKSHHTITSSPGGGASGKESPCNTGDRRDPGSIPGSGRSSGYSCLENAREKETWWTKVHRFPKIWTGLKQHFMLAESEEEQKSLLMKVKVENEKLA